MDKKTILAIVLTIVVIVASMIIQVNFFSNPSNAEATSTTQTEAQTPTSTESTTQPAAETQKAIAAVTTAKNTSKDEFKFETNLFDITFDPVGASISSLMMKEHSDADGTQVDLVFKGEGDNNAFLLYWGDDVSTPILDAYGYTIDGQKVIFTNDYKDSEGHKFTVRKTYEFKDDQYLFAVTVDIVGDEGFTGLDNGGYSYTLGYEPQVGPSFTQMKNNNYNYRRSYVEYYKSNGKLKKSTVGYKNGVYTNTDQVKWISLTGKYFTVVALPADDTLGYKYIATQNTNGSIPQSNGIFVSKPSTTASTSDTIYFYAGPQLKKYLDSYYNGLDNPWGLKNTNLDAAVESGSFFEWLENILKWALTLLYKIIPNYGVGIIILTIIIKILLWPLSKKSLASTARMSELQPKMKELQEKYKDNPQKLNQETAALYKEAGVSPLGGCLPMLLQFPILIAMYGLLNKHFELRGAMFIPGWIPDLSVPETIFTLGFNIPLLGNEIHLLPILYTVSMIFSMKITQTQSSGTQNGAMMKFMTYGMPILFFFILYSAPSGLLLYWSVQNVLSMLQQFYTNGKLKKNPNAFAKKKKKGESDEKVPEAVRKYQEKLKMLEEAKAKAAKEQAKKNKKN